MTVPPCMVFCTVRYPRLSPLAEWSPPQPHTVVYTAMKTSDPQLRSSRAKPLRNMIHISWEASNRPSSRYHDRPTMHGVLYRTVPSTKSVGRVVPPQPHTVVYTAMKTSDPQLRSSRAKPLRNMIHISWEVSNRPSSRYHDRPTMHGVLYRTVPSTKSVGRVVPPQPHTVVYTAMKTSDPQLRSSRAKPLRNMIHISWEASNRPSSRYHDRPTMRGVLYRTVPSTKSVGRVVPPQPHTVVYTAMKTSDPQLRSSRAKPLRNMIHISWEVSNRPSSRYHDRPTMHGVLS